MDIGINFRSGSGYVTDPAGTTYCLHTDTYPTTRGGFTFGWVTDAASGADRDSGIDARLAGINYATFNNPRTFRLDLDASGSKDIYLANGDTFAQDAQDVEIFDDTASLIHLTAGTTTANHWVDATGVDRTSSSDWASNNAASTQTFATTILKMTIAGHSANGATVVAHLRVADATAGGRRWIFGSNLLP